MILKKFDIQSINGTMFVSFWQEVSTNIILLIQTFEIVTCALHLHFNWDNKYTKTSLSTPYSTY